VGGSAETVWLWFNDLVDRFEFVTVHMEERGWSAFFLGGGVDFLKISFQLFFFCILFIF